MPDMAELQALVAHMRSVGEASRMIDKSPTWTRHLAETGVLQGIRTRVGWLLTEDSLRAYNRQQG